MKRQNCKNNYSSRHGYQKLVWSSSKYDELTHLYFELQQYETGFYSNMSQKIWPTLWCVQVQISCNLAEKLANFYTYSSTKLISDTHDIDHSYSHLWAVQLRKSNRLLFAECFQKFTNIYKSIYSHFTVPIIYRSFTKVFTDFYYRAGLVQQFP